MRAKAYVLKKQILNQRSKQTITSCTIPNWQKYRINHVRFNLISKIKNAGFRRYITEGTIELLALKLFLRKMNRTDQGPKCCVQYNSDTHTYSKINLNIESADDYFFLRNKRSHLRVSIAM